MVMTFGRKLRAGTLRGSITALDGVRILGPSGHAGHMLVKLRARDIADYQESKVIRGDWTAVIGVIPQGQKIEIFESSRVSK